MPTVARACSARQTLGSRETGRATLVALVSLAISLSLSRQAPRLSDIHGVWEGRQHGKILRLTFRFDGWCILELRDPLTGDRARHEGRFDLQVSKSPATLSIRNLSRLDHALHTAIEFVSRDVMRIESFARSWRLRPLAFRSESSVLLYRIEGADRPATPAGVERPAGPLAS